MKKKFIEFYMKVAEHTAEMSSAVRLKVGAIVVKDDRIISLGYNGTPAGWDNNCEYIEFMPYDQIEHLDKEEIWHEWPMEGQFWIDNRLVTKRYRLKTKPEVLHAEMNALMKLARSNESGDNASLFLTHSPCLECAKGIYQAGIKNVYYRNQYRNDDGISFLNRCKIQIEQI